MKKLKEIIKAGLKDKETRSYTDEFCRNNTNHLKSKPEDLPTIFILKSGRS